MMEMPHVAAHAVQILIERGEDYTDPYKFYDAIYEVNFVGCSGKVKFDKTLHVRKDPTFEVKQLQKIDGVAQMVHIIKHCPGCAVVWKYAQKLQFADRRTVFDEDFPEFKDCGRVAR